MWPIYLPSKRMKPQKSMISLFLRLLSAVHASLASGAGLYIMWETMDDCLYSRYRSSSFFSAKYS